MQGKILTVVILVLLLLLNNIASALPSGPWKGRIIDIETKEPLEGAVVVAVWERVWKTPAGGVADFYEIKEVLTNQEGNYEMPSYTPINLLPILSYIRGPEFTIFKPGYLSLSGRHLDENVIDNSAEFKRDEKLYRLAPGIIELPKLKTREERLMAMPGPIGEDSGYKKQKLFIQLLNEENKNLGLKGEYKIEK
ncbi:MAG: hypothetical protein HZB30_10275 [Nitrospirae bacterium]|nr:hypothetical protein [Nitrospirota bacterium]